jgi:hypothetical protein
MTKETRNILILTSVSVAIIVATLVWFFVKKNREEERILEEKEKQKQAEKEAKETNIIKPTFNRNGELTNKLSDIKGKQIIAKTDSVNLRTTARIDNPTVWAPYDTNLLAKVKKNTVIGTLVGETKGEENPKMRWLAIKLVKPIKMEWKTAGGFDPLTAGLQLFSESAPGIYNYAWVRADVATFKEFKK